MKRIFKLKCESLNGALSMCFPDVRLALAWGYTQHKRGDRILATFLQPTAPGKERWRVYYVRAKNAKN